jgi:hypothetical protein
MGPLYCCKEILFCQAPPWRKDKGLIFRQTAFELRGTNLANGLQFMDYVFRLHLLSVPSSELDMKESNSSPSSTILIYFEYTV